MAIDMTQLEMVRTRYSEEWDRSFQQLTERVAPYVTALSGMEGNYYEFPQIGKTEVREYSGTRQTMTEDDLLFGKRGMRYRKYYNVIPLSIDEAMDMKKLSWTFGEIQREQISAAKRFLDMVALGVVWDDQKKKYRVKTDSDEGFCGGILGTNYGGEGGTEKYELNLDDSILASEDGNIVPVDYKSSFTGASENLAGTFLDKLFLIKSILEEKNVYDGTEMGEICVAISPAVKRQLQTLEIVLNHDYGFGNLGDAGGASLNNKLNVTFLVTNMLPTMDTETTGGQQVEGARMCCAWLKPRVISGTWRNTEFTLKDVNDMVDIDNKLRVRGAFGCGRKDEQTVFVMPTVES